MIALLLGACLSGVTITLPSEARVRGTEMELGEIAKISGDDPKEVALFEALELGGTPAPGYSRVLTIETVRELVELRMPAADYQVVGERACRVWPEVLEVSGSSIEAVARAELARIYGGREVSISLNGAIGAVKVPAGGAPPHISARTRQVAPRSGLISIPVDVRVEAIRYRTVWTSWQVELFELRSVLAESVRAGEELRPGMFVERRVSVPPGHPSNLLNGAMIVGAVAKRDLTPGESLTSFDVHRPTVLMVGDPLTLRVSKGAVSAQIMVQALEPAAIGDRIRVRTLGTGRELAATIRSRDFCELTIR